MVVPPLSVPVPRLVAPSRKLTEPVGVPVIDEVIDAVSFRLRPSVRLDAEGVSVVVDAGAAFTVTASEEDVDPAKLLSPEYVAVMGWEPTVSVEVLKVAVPELIVPVPIVVPLSLKVTEPDGVPLAVEETVAVNFTLWPTVMVDAVVLSTVTVAEAPPVMTWVIVGDCEPLYEVSPVYAA